MYQSVLLTLIAPTYDGKGQAKSGQAELSIRIGVPQPTLFLSDRAILLLPTITLTFPLPL